MSSSSVPPWYAGGPSPVFNESAYLGKPVPAPTGPLNIHPEITTPGSYSLGGVPTAPTASATTKVANNDGLANFGLIVSGGGALLSIAGTYYGLKAQQGAYKAEADNVAFAANQANMAARAAEREAAMVIYAGQRAAAWRGAQEASDVSKLRAGTAASGVEVGSGSAGELERAARLAAELDKRSIRTNAERRASAMRESAANMRAGATLGYASAEAMKNSAKAISPVAGAVGTTLGSSANLIGQYLAYYGRR